MGFNLELSGITKKYGDTTVLQDVGFNVRAGEIVGLVGENGAGKSTLLKILGGSPDISSTGGYEGRLSINGRELNLSSARARDEGIGMVHQELALLDEFSITENICLGRERVRHGLGAVPADWRLIDGPADQKAAGDVLARLGLQINPALRVRGLSAGLKHPVEMAREIARDDLKLLLLDEPTAGLESSEAAGMLNVIRTLADAGCAVIFVSHRLEEVVGVADRIIVLRDGSLAACFEKPGAADMGKIVEAMLGREQLPVVRERRSNAGESILELRDFAVQMPGEPLRELNLNVYRGEILGLAGLAGHGKAAVNAGIAGICSWQGELIFRGRSLAGATAASLPGRGIYHIPAERRRHGILMDQSLAYNLVFPAFHYRGMFRRRVAGCSLPWMDQAAIMDKVRSLVDQFDIQCSSLLQKAGELSGGNQQKLCLARATLLEPELLLITEPTRGIDIGAKGAVLRALVRMNEEQGASIVCASSEPGDLQALCDRVAVLHESRLRGVYDPCDPGLARAIAGLEGGI